MGGPRQLTEPLRSRSLIRKSTVPLPFHKRPRHLGPLNLVGLPLRSAVQVVGSDPPPGLAWLRNPGLKAAG